MKTIQEKQEYSQVILQATIYECLIGSCTSSNKTSAITELLYPQKINCIVVDANPSFLQTIL